MFIKKQLNWEVIVKKNASDISWLFSGYLSSIALWMIILIVVGMLKPENFVLRITIAGIVLTIAIMVVLMFYFPRRFSKSVNKFIQRFFENPLRITIILLIPYLVFNFIILTSRVIDIVNLFLLDLISIFVIWTWYKTRKKIINQEVKG